MSSPAVSTRVAIDNILLATDFSSCSDSALTYAAGIARRYGSTLSLVSVVPTVPYDLLPADPLRPLQVAGEQMEALSTSEKLKGIQHKEYVEQGDVSTVLGDMVRQFDIDLIVLGTHGRRGIEKLLMGSVAEDVFRHAACPVMTVGPRVTHKIEEGALRHILYATNFGEETFHGLPYALSLAEEHHAKITLLHVAPEPPLAVPTAPNGWISDVFVSERMAYEERQLHELMPPDTDLATHPGYMVEFGDAPPIIVDTAHKLDADIIVMGVKRPLPLGTHLTVGTAYRVVCQAPCPVLTVGHDFLR